LKDTYLRFTIYQIQKIQKEKNMKRRFLILLTLLVTAAMILTACGGGTPADTGEEAAAPAEGETVALRLWTHQNNAFNAGYEALIEAYMKENPNVEITLETFEYDLYIQTLQTSMPAGEEADILQIFGTWTSEYAERLAPAPESVMTVAEAEDTFYGAPVGDFIVDGKLYGLPQEFNLEYGGVLVNKSMYEAAGLTYPPEWKTMDNVLADAKALAQVDDTGMMSVSGFHFTSSDGCVFSFLAGIKQRGGDYWNADKTGFTFNTPEAKETLEWIVDGSNGDGYLTHFVCLHLLPTLDRAWVHHVRI